MQERKNCERIRIITVIGMIFVLIMTIAGGKTRVQAAGAALSVSSVSAEKGGTVTVNVSLSNNPGIYGIKVKTEYDSSALQLKSMSNGNVFPVSEAICNEAKGVYVANSSDFNNVTGNGILFTLEFKVLDGADAASCNVSVKLEKAQNVDGGKIDVSGGSGKVTVEKCIHNKKTQTIAATCETEGETKVVCTKCGEVFEKNKIPATGHKNTEIKNKVDATTTTEGYTGDTYCKDCGKLIASGTKIEKLPSKSDSPKSDEKTEVKKPDNNTTATAKNTEKKTEKKTSDSKKTKSKKTKENTADVAKTSEKATEKATEKASETELVTETESETEITETTEQTEKKDTMKDTKKEEVKKSSGVPKAAAVVVLIAVIGAIGAGLYFFVMKKTGR